MALLIGAFGNHKAVAAGSGTSSDPFTVAADAYRVTSGRYFFNLGNGIFEADVDNTEGGGWILVLQYVHQGGGNPALDIIGSGENLPITSTAALGADESADTARWGHAGNAAMSQFSGDIELRWFGQTNGHNRTLHFRSPEGIEYARTGLGDFLNIRNNFTLLSGHSANLPASIQNAYTDEGDFAFTNFPFWLGGAFHFGIRASNIGGSGANGFRWEVDDFANGSQNDTIHRIWVRASAPLTVTNTNDAGLGSLRSAITIANDNANLDDITFNIPGAGPHRIAPISPLPAITDAGITIDGSTQPSAACGQLSTANPHNIRIELFGSGTSSGTALRPQADGITIRGLSITSFDQNAIDARNQASNLLIECNYIGVEPNGITKGPNSRREGSFSGVYLERISSPVIRNNLISGNDDDAIDNGLRLLTVIGSIITGNIIGLDASGTSILGNGSIGLTIEGSSTGIIIGGTSAIERNIISGNGSRGINISSSSSNITILGNYIGTDINGSADLGNLSDGILLNVANNINIGNGSASGRNVISENAGSGIFATNASSGITITGNFIGVAADGNAELGNGFQGIRIVNASTIAIGNGSAAARNIISANGQEGIFAVSTVNLTINGNYIGMASNGSTARGNAADGITLQATNVQNGHANAIITNNVISANRQSGVDISSFSISNIGTSSDIILTANKVGVAADGVTPAGNQDFGIKNTNVPGSVTVGGINRADGNIVAHNGNSGVVVDFEAGAVMSIMGNSIFSNGTAGIDLDRDGITPNDDGDGDNGPNELLNYPVINNLLANGLTVSFDLNLDAPASAQGYRIEFFRNSIADPSGFGQGEVYLGFADISHPGGNINHTGTFTSLSAVPLGSHISATATRKTASGFDITSEFSLIFTSAASAQLTVKKSVQVYDPLGEGLFALPGNDMIALQTITNIGNGAVDANSIVLISAIAKEMIFFNGDIDDGGPENGPIAFGQSAGTGLSFDNANDLAFSNSPTKPSNMAECNYSPSAGYDPAVTFICINPKGIMAADDPYPNFTVQYRAMIE